MKINCQFKSLDWSESLVTYAEEKVQDKLAKFELKPSVVHVIFSAERYKKRVEMRIVGRDVSIGATATAEEFTNALEDAIEKVQKQLSKRKEKIKNHRPQ